MRQTISGLVAAFAVVAASAAPAMACGETPCGQVYIPAPVYSGCYTGCGGWGYERLPDPVQQYYPIEQYPVHQYYYVNQGPTYTGPGDFAPRRVYREEGISGWRGYHHRPHYYGYEGRWHAHRQFHSWHHYATPYRYGYHYRPHVLHSYY